MAGPKTGTRTPGGTVGVDNRSDLPGVRYVAITPRRTDASRFQNRLPAFRGMPSVKALAARRGWCSRSRRLTPSGGPLFEEPVQVGLVPGALLRLAFEQLRGLGQYQGVGAALAPGL